ncbi:YihY family inner membrane protein [Solilutibacter oculi]|nr:YihY family inner membrane protein [Lysobacter oculi]
MTALPLHQRVIGHVMERVRDRARMLTFARFVGRRFLDDRLFEAAGALAYTTAFAVVPLSFVVFGVLSAFPGFDRWTDALGDYIFNNFVPRAAEAVKTYLLPNRETKLQMTTAGVIALIVSLLVTLTSVESIFNRIWRVPTARPKFSRFLVYWTVMTLGALLAATSLALSTRLFALAIFETTAGRWLEQLMLRGTPVLIEVACFTLLYRVVPHRTIKWRHAFAGAILAALAFDLIKWALGFYFGHSETYKNLYGALALAPIFLLWIYLGWASVLLGASFAASLSAFRYQPVSMRLPLGYEMYGLLRMLGRLQVARRHGRGLHVDEIQRMEPMLTDALVQQFLCQLDAIDLVARAESGEWLLSRDLDQITLGELYEACHLRIPISEAHLPCRDDALGGHVSGVIDELRIPLRDLLKRKVSSIYDELPNESLP